MRLSEKPEAKTAGQKRSEAWFVPRPERFWPTTQASGFAASRNRLGYWDRLLMLKNAFFASKSEARSTICQNDGGQESETISNDQNTNSQNKNPLIQRFWYSSGSVVSILNLFRVSR